MRAPLNFSTTAIANLELDGDESDVWIWDADGAQHSGLGIRMRRGKTGTSKTFYAAYRFAGQDRRDRLGDVADYKLADARHRVYELRRSAADGTDPREARATKVAEAVKVTTCPTFLEYAGTYLAARESELRANTYRDRERYLLGAHSEPFHKLRLNQIDKAAIARQIKFLHSTGITKPSKHVAQAWRMCVLDLFKAAAADGLIEANPVRGTTQPAAPRQQKGRERVLTNDELVAIWRASSGDDDYSKIVRLGILLGGRRQEIGSMSWSEITNDGEWTLPADRNKTDKDLMLPLPSTARQILASIERSPERDRVFGSRSADGFVSWSGAKAALDARLPFSDWRLHDLRRTLITNLPELGVEPHVVRAIAGHSQGSDVHQRHYNKSTYRAQKAAALELWADHIARLVGDNVLPLAA
jgi:integrase